MADIICHNNGRYNLYSSITDSFRFDNAITLKELKSAIFLEFGETGLSGLPARLNRAHKQGVSALGYISLKDFLRGNRAGENEKELSYQECLSQYLS